MKWVYQTGVDQGDIKPFIVYETMVLHKTFKLAFPGRWRHESVSSSSQNCYLGDKKTFPAQEAARDIKTVIHYKCIIPDDSFDKII